MRFYDTSTTAYSEAKKDFTSQGGVLTIEWKFMEPSVGSLAYFSLHDGDTEAVLMRTTTADGGSLVYVDGFENYYTIRTISSNTWYTVKIVADMVTNSYDIYVDGVLKVVGAPFKNYVNYVDRIMFAGGYSVPSTVYIDNVRIY
jgi:hypothetical protein